MLETQEAPGRETSNAITRQVHGHKIQANDAMGKNKLPGKKDQHRRGEW